MATRPLYGEHAPTKRCWLQRILQFFPPVVDLYQKDTMPRNASSVLGAVVVLLFAATAPVRAHGHDFFQTSLSVSEAAGFINADAVDAEVAKAVGLIVQPASCVVVGPADLSRTFGLKHAAGVPIGIWCFVTSGAAMTAPLFRLFACGLAISCLSACSTRIFSPPIPVPAYVGALRPVGDVGVFLPAQLTSIRSIDGVRVNTNVRAEIPFGLGGWEIEMLPGPRTLEFAYNNPTTQMQSTTPLTKVFTVESEHIYAVTATHGLGSRWDVKIDDVTAREQSALAARRHGLNGK